MRSIKQKTPVNTTVGICLDNQVKCLPIETLKINPRNSLHSDKQIDQIATSIAQFGFTNPILITPEREVIAGHGRLAAATLLGHTNIQTLTISGLSNAKKRALALADNRLAEGATWDSDKLRVELAELVVLDEISIEITGFSTSEVDLLLDETAAGGALEEDEMLPIPLVSGVVSRPGDLWQLGPHRLLCGDATDSLSYSRLLNGRKADLVFTDPPYNLKIGGLVSGLGKIRHREFAMASGEMSFQQFVRFLKIALGHHAEHSQQASIHFVCMDWRHIYELMIAGREVYSSVKNICVWAKTNGGMGRLYRAQHEFVVVFQNGFGRFTNNVKLGADGRYRTNVWTYRGMNSMHQSRTEDLALHPTIKPVPLVADAIRDCSKRNELVLDAFAGSGTTILAAHRTGRVAAVILEVKPPRGDEIKFEDIRKLFIKLKELGMNLKWITYDSFQSTDSLQLLRQAGFITGRKSIDKDSVPYDVMRTAFYDGRVEAPEHQKALEEIIRLERNPKTGLIDHAPRFSKDCADAVAGVVHGLTYQRAIWAHHRVPTHGAIENVIVKEERSLAL